MIINLIDIWNNSLEEKKLARDQNIEKLKTSDESYELSIDDKYMQSSIEFNSSVRLIPIKSSQSLEPVNYYDDLPTIPLNEEETSAVEQRRQELSKKQNFYDGNHILVKNALYDTESKILYFEVVRVKYSFLNTLQAKKFPENSKLYQLKLYKTGVIAPFITQDNHVFLMERNDPFKLYSAASGFLEPVGEKKELTSREYDLIVHTAMQEALEEFLSHKSSPTKSRVPFDLPFISSLSFREIEGAMGTIEFIAPMQLHCRKETLEAILKDNHAKDKHEHTNHFHALPLQVNERDKAIQFLQLKKPGSFLYDPIVLTASSVINSLYDNDRNFYPTHLPHSRTCAIPVDAFALSVQYGKALTWQRELQSKEDIAYTSNKESQLSVPKVTQSKSLR